MPERRRIANINKATEGKLNLFMIPESGVSPSRKTGVGGRVERNTNRKLGWQNWKRFLSKNPKVRVWVLEGRRGKRQTQNFTSPTPSTLPWPNFSRWRKMFWGVRGTARVESMIRSSLRDQMEFLLRTSGCWNGAAHTSTQPLTFIWHSSRFLLLIGMIFLGETEKRKKMAERVREIFQHCCTSRRLRMHEHKFLPQKSEAWEEFSWPKFARDPMSKINFHFREKCRNFVQKKTQKESETRKTRLHHREGELGGCGNSIYWVSGASDGTGKSNT